MVKVERTVVSIEIQILLLCKYKRPHYDEFQLKISTSISLYGMQKKLNL